MPCNCEFCAVCRPETDHTQCIRELGTADIADLNGEKGDPDYWLDAVRDFWAETGFDTDSWELRVIVAWFDKRRRND